jgi:CheY-like chemotaxis protein
MVHLEVSDTGIGIAPDTAGRLFEPFSQADASTTRRYGGTGLGLAICRRLAEAMGGSIGVESELGRGSTFWIDVPLGRVAPAVPAPDAPSPSLEGWRALVVDDSPTNRLVLSAQLLAWGITADLAPDADAALDHMRRAASDARPYDLVLVDMAMPGMDGLDLARLVTSDPALSSARLFLLSSVPVDADVAANAGVVARLAKPTPLAQLYDALLRAVGPSVGRAPVAGGADQTPTTGSHGWLLIVEDNAINQAVAKGLAAKLGFGCDVAGNGIEALAALGRRHYDAVLMDCQMPEMDGFEATAEIRRREAGRTPVPIIAMTAGALVEDRERCLGAGMDDYLAKPVKGRELERVLNRWLAAGGGDSVNAGP